MRKTKNTFSGHSNFFKNTLLKQHNDHVRTMRVGIKRKQAADILPFCFALSFLYSTEWVFAPYPAEKNSPILFQCLTPADVAPSCSPLCAKQKVLSRVKLWEHLFCCFSLCGGREMEMERSSLRMSYSLNPLTNMGFSSVFTHQVETFLLLFWCAKLFPANSQFLRTTLRI